VPKDQDIDEELGPVEEMMVKECMMSTPMRMLSLALALS
jgi:hypothetical protein